MILMSIGMALLGGVSLLDRGVPPIFYLILIPAAFLLIKFIKHGRLEWTFYALTAYLPFSKQVSGTFIDAWPWLNLSNILLLTAVIFYLLEQRKNPWQWSKPGILLILFSAIALFSICRFFLYGPVYLLATSYQFFRSWGYGFILFFLFLNGLPRDIRAVRNIVSLMIMVITFIGLMASYDYLTSGDRIGGVFNHANILSSFFSYYMYLPAAFIVLNLKQWQAWGLLFPFLACTRGLMVAFSRGGYLAFAVSLLILTFFRSRILFLAAVALTFFAVYNPSILPEGVRHRLSKTIETHEIKQGGKVLGKTTSLDRSTADRLKLWESCLDFAKEHPISGIGYGRFQRKVQNHWYAGIAFDPHNTFLWLLAEIGIPGLAVYVIFLGWMTFIAVRLYSREKDYFICSLALGFAANMGGFVVSNCYAPRLDFPEVYCYFWIMAAILTRLSSPLKEGSA